MNNTILELLEKTSVGIDPKIDTWFLMKTPVTMLSITIFYVVFVTKLGPWLMKFHPGYKLKEVLLAYNLLQVLLCLFILSHVFRAGLSTTYTWFFDFGCRTEVFRDPKSLDIIASGVFWYVIAKLLDLVDTVFFVLRKKSNQITFLHIYHHTLMFSCSWYYLKYIPAEGGVFIGLINSFVHVFMYIYYGISALGPKYREYLWWKKYITWMQLIQFGIVVIYMLAFILLGCTYDKVFIAFYIANAFLFIYLFGRFYQGTYVKKSDTVDKDKISKKAE